MSSNAFNAKYNFQQSPELPIPSYLQYDVLTSTLAIAFFDSSGNDWSAILTDLPIKTKIISQFIPTNEQFSCETSSVTSIGASGVTVSVSNIVFPTPFSGYADCFFTPSISLESLGDVTITAPVNGEVLTYTISGWVNGSGGGGGSGASTVNTYITMTNATDCPNSIRRDQFSAGALLSNDALNTGLQEIGIATISGFDSRLSLSGYGLNILNPSGIGYALDLTDVQIQNGNSGTIAIGIGQSQNPPLVAPAAGAGALYTTAAPDSHPMWANASLNQNILLEGDGSLIVPTYPISLPTFSPGEFGQYSLGESKFVNVPNPPIVLSYLYAELTTIPSAGYISVIDGTPNKLYVNINTLVGQDATNVLTGLDFKQKLSCATTPLQLFDFLSNGTLIGSVVNFDVSGISQTTFTGGNSVTLSFLPKAPVFKDSSNNVGVGNTLSALTSGTSNIAVGNSALNSLTTAINNVAMGNEALTSLVSAPSNTGIGNNALRALASGQGLNTAVGVSSLLNLATGKFNTGLGALSAYAYTGDSITALGYQCMTNCTTGAGNTGVGYNTMIYVTTGSNNTAIGSEAFKNIAAADTENTVVGAAAALGANGSYNTVLGSQTASNCTGMTSNVIIGSNAQSSVVASLTDNVLIGTRADLATASATNNTVVGYQASATGNSSIVLGANASAPASNSFVLAGITTSAVTPAAGGGGALPAAVETYLEVYVNTVKYKVPMYLA